MTKYKVVRAIYKEMLENIVNDAIREGWSVSGGVAIHINKFGSVEQYFQAMVR